MHSNRETFRGRIFLFETILIYTKYVQVWNKLTYQGHFNCAEIDFQCDPPNRVYIRSGDNQIAFSCGSNQFHKWMQNIR